MTAQVDTVGAVAVLGGAAVAIVDLARVRAERAERDAAQHLARATAAEERATEAEERRRQAEASLSFWHAEAQDLARRLEASRRREWLMVAFCALVGALALAIVVVAMRGA